jgi:GT2 family glycosyltransferase
VIYVVIAVKNRLSFTRRCLAALAAQNCADVTTIVVDDGSTDGTLEALPRDFPSVILLKGDGDLWWTAATNRAVAWALERAIDDDYVLTLNNDTSFDADYLDNLLTAAEENRPALIGSLAVDPDRGVVVEGGVRVNWLTAKKLVLARGVSLADLALWRPPPVAVDVLPGRGTLIPVSAFRSVGLYDATSLPHYGADYEFSRRAASSGYRLLVSYRAVLRVNPDKTGLHASHGPWAFLASFATRRSANELGHRWRYARLVCPRSTVVPYAVMDTLRVVVGGFRRQVLASPGGGGAGVHSAAAAQEPGTEG